MVGGNDDTPVDLVAAGNADAKRPCLGNTNICIIYVYIYISDIYILYIYISYIHIYICNIYM